MIITSCITARGFVMIEELKVVPRQLVAESGFGGCSASEGGS